MSETTPSDTHNFAPTWLGEVGQFVELVSRLGTCIDGVLIS